MKNKCSAQFRLGDLLLKFVLLNFAFFFAIQNVYAQKSKTKFNIQEKPDEIIIQSPRYLLSINKFDADCQLKNEQNAAYTSFPLDIEFNPGEDRQRNALDYRWKIQGKKIILSAFQNSMVVKEAIISCDDNSFQIQLGCNIPASADYGIFLLHRNGLGFDTSGWEEYFSPEPDDYFRSSPTVDVRVDRDQQWSFAPAPLNLSFKTPAGWFSIGLAELPDASIFAFRQESLWMDFVWKKNYRQVNQMYWFTPLIFTFNDSPWQAVSDYSAQVVSKYVHQNKNSENETKPAWWTNPLVSTWGEQTVQHMTANHSGFNSEWVRWYVQAQETALDDTSFTLIIDDNWSRAYGDPHPANRFRELRSLIDWCHERGHKVILFWKAWKVEAGSIAIGMNVIDGEYVDSTHPMFESYVDSCSQILFGNSPEGLDADGLKIDYLFLVRDPATANYFDAAKGMGFKEVKNYLAMFRQKARSYKTDALIMGSAIDPHFSDVQDMVRIHDDWDNKTRREKRARIITQAMPGMLINGDAAEMSQQMANYHYVTSSIYGIPNFQYLTRFQDGGMTPEIQMLFNHVIKLYRAKPTGTVNFVDYGHWQIINKDGDVSIESIRAGKGLLFYTNNNEASFLCTENSRLHLVFERYLLRTIHDEGGIKIPFTDLGNGLYELTELEQGKIYKLELKKASTKSR